MTNHPRQWLTLDVSTPLDVDHVRAALTGLCSLSGSPLIVLEARGSRRTVTWRVGCARNDASRVRDVLQAHLPRIHAAALDLPVVVDRADATVRLRYRGSAQRPLAHDEPESAARGVLAALTRAGRDESVTLQLVLGARWHPSVEPDQPRPYRRLVRQKWSEPRFSCELRVGAEAVDAARTRSLINGVVAAARVLQAPGVVLQVRRTSIDGFSQASVPWFWRTQLTPTDLVPLTAWPIGQPPLPGVASPHPRRLAATPAIPQEGQVVGDSMPPRARPIALKPADALRHLHIIGPTGVGKSTLMANLAVQDIAAGRGLALIDPKGDLVDEVLRRIPEHRHGDVVVLNPLDIAPVGIDSLSGDPDRAADVVLGVFHSLYAANWGPRTQDILHAALLTLARRGDASLALVPTLLTNPGFRRSVVGSQVKADPLGLGSFWGWYEAISDAERLAAIAPVLNKLRPILLRPGMRHVLGQRHPRFTLSDVFNQRRILLVSLNKGELGPEAAQLLGAMVVSLLWDAARARTNRAEPVSIYIDEVQDYLRLPGDLGDALAQARGLGVGFTLAHQHLGQLPAAIREAILTNARSRIMFQLSHRDARDLAATSRREIEADDLEVLPAFAAYAALLVDNQPAPWASLRTRALRPALSDPAALRQRSQDRFGVASNDTDADLLGLTQPVVTDDQLGRAPRRRPS